MASLLRYNPILDTDSYKASHFLFYPPDTETVVSYAESRGGRYPATMFFGLQGYVKQLAERPITQEDIDEAEAFCADHGEPFNKTGWQIILNEHGGYLPVYIQALREGTVVPTHIPLVTVHNTDKRLPWLTSYIETALLRDVWTGTTVATRVFFMKQAIRKQFERSADDPAAAMAFALLDFSSRGTNSYESNEKTGAAFLANMIGTDSMPAVRYVNKIYNSPMAGFSVPATEHSIMCSWTQEQEKEGLEAMIKKIGQRGGGILSVVSDTWNVYQVCRYFVQLKDQIQQNRVNLVIRPDSGDFKEVLSQIFGILSNGFGFTENKKGYRVLNGVKVLWGDGINEKTAGELFAWLVDQGWSAENLMLGSGGGLVQANIDRDTCKFAFKACAVERGGKWMGISKDPITDAGKRSKAGWVDTVERREREADILDVVAMAAGLGELDPLVWQQTLFDARQDGYYSIMQPVYDNGAIIREQDIENIRMISERYLGLYTYNPC